MRSQVPLRQRAPGRLRQPGARAPVLEAVTDLEAASMTVCWQPIVTVTMTELVAMTVAV